MKQNLIIEVTTTGKGRCLARKIIGSWPGVHNAESMTGADEDKFWVTGEGIDVVKLNMKLRKKGMHAELTACTPAGFVPPPLMPNPMYFPPPPHGPPVPPPGPPMVMTPTGMPILLPPPAATSPFIVPPPEEGKPPSHPYTQPIPPPPPQIPLPLGPAPYQNAELFQYTTNVPAPYYYGQPQYDGGCVIM